MPSPRRRRALAALPLAACALAASLAGCTATNPQTTTLHYDPADGQDADLGQVSVDSILVVAKAGTRGPGTLVARLTNSSSSSRTVTFTGTGSTALDASFTVPAGASVAVGPKQTRSATLSRLASKPGGLVEIRVASGGGTKSVTIPVLTNTQPEFASLVPTTSPSSTATSAPSASAGASGSSAATGSASSTTVRSSASASSNLRPSTRSSVASSPAAAAGSSAAK